MHDFGYLPVNSKYQPNPCFDCGKETMGRHHVVPVSKGGTKVIPLCEGCHNKVHEGLILAGLIRDGLQRARENGKILGAPRKLTPGIIERITSLRNAGMSIKKISDCTNVSVGSVHSVLKSKA